MFHHMAEVDNATPVRAKEDGVVQPALAVPERAANEKLAAGKMDERKILVRLEKRNVLDFHDPTFGIVSQKNEIVPMQYINSEIVHEAKEDLVFVKLGFELDVSAKVRPEKPKPGRCMNLCVEIKWRTIGSESPK